MYPKIFLKNLQNNPIIAVQHPYKISTPMISNVINVSRVSQSLLGNINISS